MADKTRFEIPAKPVHPLGWACENCFHVVKDSTPGSHAMKCTRNPPSAQAMIGHGGQFAGAISISPPVNVGEWCGEFRHSLDTSSPFADGERIA